MYADLVIDVREALGVSTSHDASILRGIKRSAMSLLRNYNFRESLRRTAAIPLALNATSFAMPVDAGKVKSVRIRQLSGTVYLYKRLRRREEGQLPQRAEVGPVYYWFEPPSVMLDTPLPETGVEAEVWYQTISTAVAEGWLSVNYADVLTHASIYELALPKRKPEVRQAYQPVIEADTQILANYLQELEFNDLEMRMSAEARPISPRYPST